MNTYKVIFKSGHTEIINTNKYLDVTFATALDLGWDKMCEHEEDEYPFTLIVDDISGVIRVKDTERSEL